MFTHTYIYTYMYVCIYVYIIVYIYNQSFNTIRNKYFIYNYEII